MPWQGLLTRRTGTDCALKRGEGAFPSKWTVTKQACGAPSQDLMIPVRPTVAGTVPESSHKRMNRVPFSLDYGPDRRQRKYTMPGANKMHSCLYYDRVVEFWVDVQP